MARRVIYSAGRAGEYRLARVNGRNDEPSVCDLDASNMVCLSVGHAHGALVNESGDVYTWGSGIDFAAWPAHPSDFSYDVRRYNEPILAAACGHGFTIYLTKSGSLFMCGSIVENPRQGALLQAGVDFKGRLVYVTASGTYAFGINEAGVVYRLCRRRVVELPCNERFYDVAGGFKFAVAVNVRHECFGWGLVVGGKQWKKIEALEGKEVLRVFADTGRAFALTVDGTVWAWGEGMHGSLGLLESEVKVFREVPLGGVVDIGVGESHTMFVTRHGDLYGAGLSNDGRIFAARSQEPIIKAVDIGMVVNVRCGRMSTMAVVNGRPMKHLGITHFLDETAYVIDRSLGLCDVAIQGLMRLGLMFGDVVKVGDQEGIVIGLEFKSVRVQTDVGEIVVADPADVKLVTRQGFDCCEREGRLYEGGDLLERLYGLRGGEVVSQEQTCYNVLGLHEGALWLRATNGEEEPISFAESVVDFWQHYSLEQTQRKVTATNIGGVVYPVKDLHAFALSQSSTYIQVVGEFCQFYVGRPVLSSCELAFYPKQTCCFLRASGRFTQYDRVTFANTSGMLIDVSDNSGLFLTDKALARGYTPSVVPLQSLLVTASLHNDQTEPYNMSIVDAGSPDCIPSDIFFGERGLVSILGTKEGKLHAKDSNGEIFEPDLAHYLLVRRYYSIPSRPIHLMGHSLSLSVYVGGTSGLGFLPCDEVTIDGTPFVVCGTSVTDGYVIAVDRETHVACFSRDDPVLQTTTLLASPCKDTEFLKRVFVSKT